MSVLISGSLAYDYIMDFPDSFKNHILPDQLHILNVCFVIEKMKKNIGGCASNIAYTMKLLGSEPLILGPIGTDGSELLDFFKSNDISTKYIPKSTELMTSAAYITTDKDDNQIIAYYNGSADEATSQHIGDVTEKVSLALIAPTKKDAMLAHAKQCYDLRIPFCFDPSHQLTAFSDQELAKTIGQAKFYIGNDYELKLTQEKTGWDADELLNHVEVLIITLGERGSVIRTKDETIEIPPCPVKSVDDPTGAGDAYRGAFFAGYERGFDFKTCGQMASVASAYAIEHYGTVNHSYTMEEFSRRYEEVYKEPIDLKTGSA
ncbi:MAG: carbohydrate kinase family protein [Candidatus Magasanikbacteria bacterium]|nr:carbohydrate kinase family protein [Candidatus Magasanikbacteria bacterium]